MNILKTNAMKTKVLTLALIGLLLGLNVKAQGNETKKEKAATERTTTFEASINKYRNDVVEFRIDKPDADVVWFLIKDEAGKTLYQRKVKRHNTVEMDFDISKVQAGKYEYIIERNGEEYLKKTIDKS